MAATHSGARLRLTTLKPRLVSINGRPLKVATHDRIRGRALQGIRRTHFTDNPLCVECEKRGRVTLATVLDHIVALENGGSDTDANRQGLCTDCHSAKTLIDNRMARGAA